MRSTIFALLILFSTFLLKCEVESNAHPNVETKPLQKGKLRSIPNNRFSPAEMEAMLHEKGFFFIVLNDTAPEYPNQFELMKNGKIVYDHFTNLIWQQSGSSYEMPYQNVQEYISKLNEEQFAGFQDWRLPTLEEAMSLMEKTKNIDKLYIDPIFASKQKSFYTSDMENEMKAWVINFDWGTCGRSAINMYSDYVRAVRINQ